MLAIQQSFFYISCDVYKNNDINNKRPKLCSIGSFRPLDEDSTDRSKRRKKHVFGSNIIHMYSSLFHHIGDNYCSCNYYLNQ